MSPLCRDRDHQQPRHTARLAHLPLPHLLPDVQRPYRYVVQSPPMSDQSRLARRVVRPAVQAGPTRPGSDIPGAGLRLHPRGGAQRGGALPPAPRRSPARQVPGHGGPQGAWGRDLCQDEWYLVLPPPRDRSRGQSRRSLAERETRHGCGPVVPRPDPDTVGHAPAQVTADGHDANPRAMRETLEPAVHHCTGRYKDKRIEQDHHGIILGYALALRYRHGTIACGEHPCDLAI